VSKPSSGGDEGQANGAIKPATHQKGGKGGQKGKQGPGSKEVKVEGADAGANGGSVAAEGEE